MTSNLEQLKKKIRRANPKSDWKELRGPMGMILEMDRPIRLADVLLAIPNKSVVVTADGLFGCFNGIDSGVDYPQIEWNLKSDSLDNQSPETINFLMELLCKQ